MASGKLYNLARMSTATTGTGTITLNAAVSGYLSFALAGVSNGDVVSYGIKDGANSEVGTGTYTTSGTTLTRTVTKSTNSDAAISLSGTAEVFITPRAEDLRATPTRQIFTSGSGTYTTPANCLWIEVELVGAGGAGVATGTGASTGTNGGATTFNAGAITAPGGSTNTSNSQVSGAGGVAGVGGDYSIPGGSGENANGAIALGNAGSGGNGYFGGSGRPSRPSAGDPGAGATNSGAGGGGGQSGSAVGAGGGGGAGAYTNKIITSPASSYTYAVGAGGTGGVAGTNGSVGGAGAAGIIIVTEHYGP